MEAAADRHSGCRYHQKYRNYSESGHQWLHKRPENKSSEMCLMACFRSETNTLDNPLSMKGSKNRISPDVVLSENNSSTNISFWESFEIRQLFLTTGDRFRRFLLLVCTVPLQSCGNRQSACKALLTVRLLRRELRARKHPDPCWLQLRNPLSVQMRGKCDPVGKSELQLKRLINETLV